MRGYNDHMNFVIDGKGFPRVVDDNLPPGTYYQGKLIISGKSLNFAGVKSMVVKVGRCGTCQGDCKTIVLYILRRTDNSFQPMLMCTECADAFSLRRQKRLVG